MIIPDLTQKLQRTFVREEAYLILRDWIVQQKLKPGEQLRDKELAEQLGVSRTPIREALLRLEDEGFVRTKPNRSTAVAPINLHEALHLYSIAWSLEQLALEQAFQNIAEEEMQLMGKANQRIQEAVNQGNGLLALETDYEFHSVYVDISQNKELKRILAGLRQKLKRLELYYFNHAGDVDVSCDEHNQLIEAIVQKDLALSLNLVKLNWQRSFTRISNRFNII